MGLTQKQEAFVVKYLECDNATQAYRHAYNAGKMPPESIHVKANEVKSNVKVALRIKELKEAIQSKVLAKVVIDRTFLTNGILDTIEASKEDGDRSNTLKGYDMLGKMYDLNEDKLNDRKVLSDKDKLALVETLKLRMVNVTPKGE